MEKGGSAAQRAMAAKYAKALKADQVAWSCQRAYALHTCTVSACHLHNEQQSRTASLMGPIGLLQVAKLLCFCTRPAIYSPPLNWLCEFISTIALVSCATVARQALAPMLLLVKPSVLY